MIMSGVNSIPNNLMSHFEMIKRPTGVKPIKLETSLQQIAAYAQSTD